MPDAMAVTCAQDLQQLLARRRALLAYADDCEREAVSMPPGGASSEIWDEARYARLAAQALPVDA